MHSFAATMANRELRNILKQDFTEEFLNPRSRRDTRNRRLQRQTEPTAEVEQPEEQQSTSQSSSVFPGSSA